MRGTLLIIALVALATPAALAQADEPTVNDTDYDTTTPPDDQSYIDEAEMESTTMDDSEFDTSLPADDQSYINEDVPGEGASGSGASAGASDTPGFGIVALVAALGLAAVSLRRR